MNTWAPIWSGIVDSSLWEESGDVVKVFMTLLATKDSDHISRYDAYKIGKKCNLDELMVMDILKLLASPDKRRKSPQEFDGRRIKAVEDGWLILNGEKYRELVAEERRKARNRRSQEAFRRRQREQPLKGEVETLRALAEGRITQEEFDQRAAYTREHNTGLEEAESP